MKRRDFLAGAAIGAGGLVLASNLSCKAEPVERVTKRPWGIALMGLGYYSTDVLAPALQQTKNVKLTGIVTGTPEKEKIWEEKYGIKQKNIYNYENFDKIAENGEIDIVYVVLPNSMHKEFTIRAAEAGKHVLCEKPMALSSQECQDMIDACKKNKVRLSVGYRLHFENHTKEVMRYARDKEYGKVQYVSAAAGFFNVSKKHWKLEKAYGGGALMDMGVYSIQGARYSVGEEPISVTAQQYSFHPKRIHEVDEEVTMQLEFPGGAVANLQTSFRTRANHLYVAAERGWYEIIPMSGYSGQTMRTRKGMVELPQVNQQATQMDDFAWCAETGHPMTVNADEGFKDLKVVEAVRRSISLGGKKTVI